MEEPVSNRRAGRPIKRERRNVSGKYFDLLCEVAGVSPKEVAKLAGVSASTISRTFSGKINIERKKLIEWGDILLGLCPEEDKPLLQAMLIEMIHTLGYSTMEDEKKGIELLPDFQRQVEQSLAKRRSKEA